MWATACYDAIKHFGFGSKDSVLKTGGRFACSRMFRSCSFSKFDTAACMSATMLAGKRFFLSCRVVMAGRGFVLKIYGREHPVTKNIWSHNEKLRLLRLPKGCPDVKFPFALWFYAAILRKFLPFGS